MTDINVWTGVGRLTRDAELKYTPNGTALSKFSIAVNRRVKRGETWEDEASFFDVVLWGKMAESINQYLLKGGQVAIKGELRQERWEKDGQKHSRVEIVAETLQLLGGKKDAAPAGAQRQDPAPQAAREHSRENDDGFTDDIPF